MNISICITTFNEEKSIGKLIESLLTQTQRFNEIIIVDSKSTDKTTEIIKHFQKKDGRIKLLIEKCSRARGRNLAIEIAKNEIIAMTDAGCVAKPNWLKNLTEPFIINEIGVVAGFYKIAGCHPASKAMGIYLGTQLRDFDCNFLPSTRSIAFRKSIWELVGGFPESLEGTAEDTVFNYKLIKNSVKICRVKNAIVEWGTPNTIYEFGFKIYEYAKGDAQSKIWNFPGKNLASHNIHSLFIIIRYLFGLVFLVCCFFYPFLFVYLLICLFAYFIWAYRKASLWGPILQITSDLGVIIGFIHGIF
jgi:glycosyltransferase involved in cell wall biosynthesis